MSLPVVNLCHVWNWRWSNYDYGDSKRQKANAGVPIPARMTTN